MAREPASLDLVRVLREHGVQPSAQRLAIAECVLAAVDHPAADTVLARVQERLPLVSRATVYNTLHRFVEAGLLRELSIAEGRTVYDPKLDPHHHFVDLDSGAIHDLPWDALEVRGVEQLSAERLSAYDVRDYQVVLRGRRHARRRAP
ncbi:MAG: transcriptional repressor [Planctomycetes bacterium]|nr:transcriptional repressor [Planctomycetota bacterium]